MSNKTITVTYTTAEGDEAEETFPARNEVCDECNGDGFVLREGMRGYAYSAEEFAEAFDDEERAEYFTRGGRYDVQCPTCKGANVVPVVDESRLTDAQKESFAEYEEWQEQIAQWDAEDRVTRMREDGNCGY